MGRRAIKTEISRGDKSQLQRWANSRTISVQQRDRAVMVLESARGTPVNEIAQKLGTYPNKVIMWRDRYQDKGLLGLKDKPRKGRPLRYKGLREKLLRKINDPVPQSYSRWDAALLSPKESRGPKPSTLQAMRYGEY